MVIFAFISFTHPTSLFQFMYQMEPISSLYPDIKDVGPGKAEGNTAEVEGFGNCVDDIFTKVDKVRLNL